MASISHINQTGASSAVDGRMNVAVLKVQLCGFKGCFRSLHLGLIHINRILLRIIVLFRAGPGPDDLLVARKVDLGKIKCRLCLCQGCVGRVDLRNEVLAITGLPFWNYAGHEGLDTRSDLGGLNLSKVPKVLIETGNMRNSTDAALLVSAGFRDQVAKAIAQGISDFVAGR